MTILQFEILKINKQIKIKILFYLFFLLSKGANVLFECMYALNIGHGRKSWRV